MNDRHLDPPEYPEPPDWYSSLEDVLEVMSPPELVSNAIRKALDDWNQECNADHKIEPVPDLFPEELGYPSEKKCPHGKVHQCDYCEYLADQAFDAAREAQFFGR